MTPTKGGYTSHKEANTSFRITLNHGIATFNSGMETTHPDKCAVLQVWPEDCKTSPRNGNTPPVIRSGMVT